VFYVHLSIKSGNTSLLRTKKAPAKYGEKAFRIAASYTTRFCGGRNQCQQSGCVILAWSVTYVNAKRQVKQHPDYHDWGKGTSNFARSKRLNQEDYHQDGAGDPNNS
jgi:hypothetical protein